MNLLGLELQKAGLSFLRATARHSADGVLRIDEIVCRTAEDAARVDAWAAEQGYPVIARVATAEEIRLYSVEGAS